MEWSGEGSQGTSLGLWLYAPNIPLNLSSCPVGPIPHFNNPHHPHPRPRPRPLPPPPPSLPLPGISSHTLAPRPTTEILFLRGKEAWKPLLYYFLCLVLFIFFPLFQFAILLQIEI